MANPNPKPGRLFKKGNNANPLGAGAHNKELKAIARLTREEIADIGSLILKKNVDALQAIVKDKESSTFKVWVASIAIKAINRGDAAPLDIILNRIVGKVKEDVNLSGSVSVANTEMTVEEYKKFREAFKDEY